MTKKFKQKIQTEISVRKCYFFSFQSLESSFHQREHLALDGTLKTIQSSSIFSCSYLQHLPEGDTERHPWGRPLPWMI